MVGGELHKQEVIVYLMDRYRIPYEDAVECYRLVVKPGMGEQDRPMTEGQLNEFCEDLEMADLEDYRTEPKEGEHAG